MVSKVKFYRLREARCKFDDNRLRYQIDCPCRRSLRTRMDGNCLRYRRNISADTGRKLRQLKTEECKRLKKWFQFETFKSEFELEKNWKSQIWTLKFPLKIYSLPYSTKSSIKRDEKISWSYPYQKDYLPMRAGVTGCGPCVTGNGTWVGGGKHPW